MTQITPYVERFNKLLHYKSRTIVKEVLTSYMKSSYFAHDAHDYCHLDEPIVSYAVKYEYYWKNHICYWDTDAKREMIYVYTKSGKEYRLSSRTVKKYIRRMKKLI